MNAEQPMSFGKILYMIWMVAGVVGFSASVGWALFCFQKYAKAMTDKEKVDRREKLRKAGVFCVAALLILVGFILFNVFGGKAA